MISFLLVPLMLSVVVAITRRTALRDDGTLLKIMVLGFVVRIVIQTFSRDLSLFSHGGGGDYMAYEYRALEINRYWQFDGLGFVTEDQYPDLGPTALPPNLYALVIALNGGDPTPMGCTAVVAAMACLACLNLYNLGVELGGDPGRARTLSTLLLFSPAFLLYTSDMYKEGPVLFVSIGALGAAVRLSRKLSIAQMVLGGAYLLALWYIRYYLVFVAVAPLLVGLTGARGSATRPLFASLGLAAAFVILVGSTDAFQEVTDRATDTFEHGTSDTVRGSNASSGSGVSFDDGGNPWGAMGPKLLYTIFSPFPWAGGSVGFHIGKIDTFLWYYILYRGWLAARRMWKADRTTLLMFLTFLVPTTIMYATSFSNVGLSLRQRLVVVMVGAVLAMQSWPARKASPAVSRAGSPPRPAPPHLHPLTARSGAVRT